MPAEGWAGAWAWAGKEEQRSAVSRLPGDSLPTGDPAVDTPVPQTLKPDLKQMREKLQPGPGSPPSPPTDEVPVVYPDEWPASPLRWPPGKQH